MLIEYLYNLIVVLVTPICTYDKMSYSFYSSGKDMGNLNNRYYHINNHCLVLIYTLAMFGYLSTCHWESLGRAYAEILHIFQLFQNKCLIQTYRYDLLVTFLISMTKIWQKRLREERTVWTSSFKRIAVIDHGEGGTVPLLQQEHVAFLEAQCVARARADITAIVTVVAFCLTNIP